MKVLNNRKFLWCVCCAVWAAGSVFGGQGAQGDSEDILDGENLLRSAFENLYSDNYLEIIDLVTESAGSRIARKSLQIIRRQDVRPAKTLIRFLEPILIRRTSILINERGDKPIEMFAFLPALKRTRRISGAQKGDAFFGTDLSYEDVEPKNASSYLAKQINIGETSGQCQVIEARTRDEVQSSYEKIRLCIDRESSVISWIEFFGSGRLLKRMEVDLSDVRQVGGRNIPFSFAMESVETKTKTLVRIRKHIQVLEVPESLFSIANLESGDAAADARKIKGIVVEENAGR